VVAFFLPEQFGLAIKQTGTVGPIVASLRLLSSAGRVKTLAFRRRL